MFTPFTLKKTGGVRSVNGGFVHKTATKNRLPRLQVMCATKDLGKLVPMTDPWDERYIYLYMNGWLLWQM